MNDNFIDKIYKISICEPVNIQKIIYKSKRIVFYDTNSFSYHCDKYNEKYYALDFFKEDDTVIFTDIIINELNAGNINIVNNKYTSYLKELEKQVSNIIILKHTDFASILGYKFMQSQCNVRLKQAFMKTFEMDKKTKEIINKINPTSTVFCNDLFKIYNLDEYQKNRGEMSIFLSTIIVSNIKQNLKFAIFTDDYSAYRYMSTLDQALKFSNDNKHLVGLCSTVRNVQILFSENKLNKENVLEYFNNISKINQSNIYYKINGYDTLQIDKFNTGDLVEKIYKNEIQVIF